MASLRVFVSHSNKDNDWCEGFVAGLQSKGLDVWYDRQGLYVGAEWVKTLEQEIQGRDIYLIVLTPDSWASQWVQRELSLALGQQKQIIGVIYKSTQVSGFITNYQLLDVTQTGAWEAAQHVAAVLTGAKTILPSPQTPQPSAQVVSGTSTIDITGEWKEEDEGLELYLSQRSEKITGTGSHSYYGNLSINGSIEGRSIKLNAPLMVERDQITSLLIELTLLPSGKMKGHFTEYRELYSAGSARITLIRVDE